MRTHFTLCKTYVLLSLLFSVLTTHTLAFELPIQHGVVAPKNISVEDYWISEKLDGIRGYWNGEQLLTRNGNIIITPEGYTKNWPKTFLDGELWSKRGDFQATLSCVKRQKVRDDCWKFIKFMIFDLPNDPETFSTRIIKMKKITERSKSNSLAMIKQFQLTTEQALYKHLAEIEALGGEGLMLHHKSAYYKSGRNNQILKLKTHHDDEAVVLAHFKGNGKYSHVLGSILVKNTDGVTFKIGTGFSDLERKDPPTIGSTITYQYIGKTKRGVPRFASFLRIRSQ